MFRFGERDGPPPAAPPSDGKPHDAAFGHRAAGFRNYAREWWHFTLADEPFPKQRFDFPVTAD
ncbi:M15 family metallopeptidase [Mesorhizobium sp. WSM3882]|uniref:M15 family metallopeptidase n=1 Tax=Mesorhizobium sp. WSM3882 TaxID=2029407 RepID=UPI0032AF4633